MARKKPFRQTSRTRVVGAVVSAIEEHEILRTFAEVFGRTKAKGACAREVLLTWASQQNGRRKEA